jgi:hypothetical protein
MMMLAVTAESVSLVLSFSLCATMEALCPLKLCVCV